MLDSGCWLLATGYWLQVASGTPFRRGEEPNQDGPDLHGLLFVFATGFSGGLEAVPGMA